MTTWRCRGQGNPDLFFAADAVAAGLQIVPGEDMGPISPCGTGNASAAFVATESIADNWWWAVGS